LFSSLISVCPSVSLNASNGEFRSSQVASLISLSTSPREVTGQFKSTLVSISLSWSIELLNLAMLMLPGFTHKNPSSISPSIPVSNIFPELILAPSIIDCRWLFLYALDILTFLGIDIPYIQELSG